jgi:hypothetical protein
VRGESESATEVPVHGKFFFLQIPRSYLDAEMVKRDPYGDTEEEEERERADLDDPDFDPLAEEFSVQLS